MPLNHIQYILHTYIHTENLYRHAVVLMKNNLSEFTKNNHKGYFVLKNVNFKDFGYTEKNLSLNYMILNINLFLNNRI